MVLWCQEVPLLPDARCVGNCGRSFDYGKAESMNTGLNFWHILPARHRQ